MSNWHWQYGWIGHFEDGSFWDSDDYLTRDEAVRLVDEFNREEAYDLSNDPEREIVLYTVRRRKVYEQSDWETYEEDAT